MSAEFMLLGLALLISSWLEGKGFQGPQGEFPVRWSRSSRKCL